MTSPELRVERRAGSSPDDDALARVIAATKEPHHHESPELRHAVRRYVLDARTRQAPPQEVLIAVKAILQRVAMPHMHAGDYAALTARAVTWCIEDYYKPS